MTFNTDNHLLQLSVVSERNTVNLPTLTCTDSDHFKKKHNSDLKPADVA